MPTCIKLLASTRGGFCTASLFPLIFDLSLHAWVGKLRMPTYIKLLASTRGGFCTASLSFLWSLIFLYMHELEN
jgi:hypothetical protein